ncbi:hypothetical protein C8R43DRAFT_1231727 [Mycena crocata]|nr:hypothetical protein C8R43DRAFT_1231727 [Mycena crocata]
MKRGFLNSAKAKARPRKSEPAAKFSGSASIDHSNFKPVGVDIYTEPCNFGNRIRAADMTFKLSLITLPMGARLDEPVSECLFFSGSKEVLTSMPSLPQSLVHPEKITFRVDTAPGKGKGLFSACALKAGDLILTERPLLVCPRGLPSYRDESCTMERFMEDSFNRLEHVYGASVQRMRPENKAAFMDLANCFKEDSSRPLLGRMRTNAMAVEGLCPGIEGDQGDYGGVCNALSCSPNTRPHFDKVSFSFRLYAARDIAVDEELTYSYVDVACPAAERNTALEKYAFTCTGTACKDVPASDGRRAAAIAFTPKVFDWAVNHALSNDWLIDECRKQLALIAREGLEHRAEQYVATLMIMYAYICLGDEQRASEWAAKVDKFPWEEESVENIGALLDPASPEYRKHPMWRLRVAGGPTDALRVSQMMEAHVKKNVKGKKCPKA